MLSWSKQLFLASHFTPRVWKEISLNASSEEDQYRVWDYPIKEQYGHILQAIEKTGPVADAATGFAKVSFIFLNI